jgi:hypothetical protein
MVKKELSSRPEYPMHSSEEKGRLRQVLQRCGVQTEVDAGVADEGEIRNIAYEVELTIVPLCVALREIHGYIITVLEEKLITAFSCSQIK